ncbi:uncharacterized protein LOC109855583 [Pseudomyrmex gracilis]|uniref:uncharacterized protein LOC109855583 n=1 Tax=Pseudomyrmex gracilis TaxID=219809 RepID=UPI000994A261|nr:uncharacterized protein LOC109855583 [Pseudomyrmex gracilis]
MSSSVKITSQLSLLGVVLLIAIYHSVIISKHANNEKESVSKSQVFRYRRAIQSATHYCRSNQYYDQKEGRCLGVPGGGKVLHVENGRSCGNNILKPHCESPLYYHICKKDKSILAQCSSKQIFDNRLQRCVQYDTITLTPSTINPHNQHQYDHVQVPNCTKPGRFPVPGYCFMFYSCESNGHRLYQSVFKCPQNTGYQVDKEICAVLSDCKNDDSVDSKICVSDAPEEIVELRNFGGATEQTVESTSERVAETATESLVKRANNDDRTEMKVSSSTETGDSYLTSTVSNGPEFFSINDASTHQDEETQNTTTEQYKTNDDVTETVQNSRTEAIDPYLTSTASNILKSFSINDASTRLNEEIQNTTTEYHDINDDVTETVQNSSTEVVDPYLASTVSDIPESSLINDASTQSDEEIQNTTTEQYKTDDDITETIQNSSPETIDPYLTSTTSDVLKSFSFNDASTQSDEEMQNTTTEQYKTDDDTTESIQNSSSETIDPYLTSTASDIPKSFPINDASTQLNEEIQNTTTEYYKIDDDVTETVQNSSTEAVDPHSTVSDVPESFSNTSPQLEETRSAITEQYEDDNRTATLSNFTPEMTDQGPTSEINDVSATTSNPYSNAFDTSTSVSDTMVSQKTVDIYEHTTEELSETTPSIESKSADTDLHETGEITTQHSRENTDDDAELSTTIAAFILRHTTTPMDSTTVTPIVQNIPAVSEKTDLVTQNSSEGLPE